MAYLVLKSLHFLGLIFWTGSLAVFIRNIREPQPLHENQIKQTWTDQINLNLYSEWLNPLMMFTWVAGITLIFHNGMDWFKMNLWIHQKIMLLIFLTVYQLYAKRLIQISLNSERVDRISGSFIKAFVLYFYFLVLAIIVLAVFRPISMLFMSIIIFMSFFGLAYISIQIFKYRRFKHN